MSTQSVSQGGHHNIIVQAQGDNIRVQIGLPRLKLIPLEARVRKQPRREIDILDPAFQAVPLVGRDQDMGSFFGLIPEPRIGSKRRGRLIAKERHG
jgi:hypothetical protein